MGGNADYMVRALTSEWYSVDYLNDCAWNPEIVFFRTKLFGKSAPIPKNLQQFNREAG